MAMSTPFNCEEISKDTDVHFDSKVFLSFLETKQP